MAQSSPCCVEARACNSVSKRRELCDVLEATPEGQMRTPVTAASAGLIHAVAVMNYSEIRTCGLIKHAAGTADVDVLGRPVQSGRKGLLTASALNWSYVEHSVGALRSSMAGRSETRAPKAPYDWMIVHTMAGHHASGVIIWVPPPLNASTSITSENAFKHAVTHRNKYCRNQAWQVASARCLAGGHQLLATWGSTSRDISATQSPLICRATTDAGQHPRIVSPVGLRARYGYPDDVDEGITNMPDGSDVSPVDLASPITESTLAILEGDMVQAVSMQSHNLLLTGPPFVARYPLPVSGEIGKGIADTLLPFTAAESTVGRLWVCGSQQAHPVAGAIGLRAALREGERVIELQQDGWGSVAVVHTSLGRLLGFHLSSNIREFWISTDVFHMMEESETGQKEWLQKHSSVLGSRAAFYDGYGAIAELNTPEGEVVVSYTVGSEQLIIATVASRVPIFGMVCAVESEPRVTRIGHSLQHHSLYSGETFPANLTCSQRSDDVDAGVAVVYVRLQEATYDFQVLCRFSSNTGEVAFMWGALHEPSRSYRCVIPATVAAAVELRVAIARDYRDDEFATLDAVFSAEVVVQLSGCPPGFQRSIKTDCEACPKNTYKPRGGDFCLACGSGRCTQQQGATSAETCVCHSALIDPADTGTSPAAADALSEIVPLADGSSCKCPPGQTLKPTLVEMGTRVTGVESDTCSAASACEPCRAGSEPAHLQNASPASKSLPQFGSGCMPCLPGWYTNGSTTGTACARAPAGSVTYKGMLSRAITQALEQNYLESSPGSTEWLFCSTLQSDRMRFGFADKQVQPWLFRTDAALEINKAQANESGACIQCSPGTYIPGDSTRDPSMCLPCGSGMLCNRGISRECPPLSVCDGSADFASCSLRHECTTGIEKPCPAGSQCWTGRANSTVRQGTMEPCPQDSYSGEGWFQCQPCPEMEGIQCQSGRVRIMRGYFAFVSPGSDSSGQRDTLAVRQCYVAAACKGSANVSQEALAASSGVVPWRCATGYEGPMCLACVDGYARFGQTCLECTAPGVMLVVWFVILAGCICVWSFLWLQSHRVWKHTRQMRRLRRVMIALCSVYLAQSVALLEVAALDWGWLPYLLIPVRMMTLQPWSEFSLRCMIGSNPMLEAIVAGFTCLLVIVGLFAYRVLRAGRVLKQQVKVRHRRESRAASIVARRLSTSTTGSHQQKPRLSLAPGRISKDSPAETQKLDDTARTSNPLLRHTADTELPASVNQVASASLHGERQPSFIGQHINDRDLDILILMPLLLVLPLQSLYMGGAVVEELSVGTAWLLYDSHYEVLNSVWQRPALYIWTMYIICAAGVTAWAARYGVFPYLRDLRQLPQRLGIGRRAQSIARLRQKPVRAETPQHTPSSMMQTAKQMLREAAGRMREMAVIINDEADAGAAVEVAEVLHRVILYQWLFWARQALIVLCVAAAPILLQGHILVIVLGFWLVVYAEFAQHIPEPFRLGEFVGLVAALAWMSSGMIWTHASSDVAVVGALFAVLGVLTWMVQLGMLAVSML